MLLHIFMIGLIFFDVKGFEFDFLINLTKRCFPRENFRGYYFFSKQNYISEEEIDDFTGFSKKASYIGILKR